MIAAVEQSQIQRLESASELVMDFFNMDPSDIVYQSFRSGTTLGLEVASLVIGVCGLVKSAVKLNRISKIPNSIRKITNIDIVSNPLNKIRYSEKVLQQMQVNLKTGLPDFHGFPKIVDNYAGLGQKTIVTGRDGIKRLKISLRGGYASQEGYFEWIINQDNIVNHRLFVSDKIAGR